MSEIVKSDLSRRKRTRVKRLPNLEKQIIVFELGEESYGIPIGCVREVLDPIWVTRIPNATEKVLGAINHHGKIYTILNLNEVLDLGISVGKTQNFLLLETADGLLGFSVGKVLEVTYYVDEILKEGFQKIDRLRSPFVGEIFRFKDQMVNMVDVEKILGSLGTILS